MVCCLPNWHRFIIVRNIMCWLARHWLLQKRLSVDYEQRGRSNAVWRASAAACPSLLKVLKGLNFFNTIENFHKNKMKNLLQLSRTLTQILLAVCEQVIQLCECRTFNFIHWHIRIMHDYKLQETQLSRTNHTMHLCKCNGTADLKTCPSPYVLPCRIWFFCIKECRHKYRGTPNIGECWNSRSVGDVRRGWP